MENLIYKDHEYRIKKMNAIELMAMQTQMSFDNYEAAEGFYKLLLEKMEVNIKDKWIPVKEHGREIYYPNGIEEDIEGLGKIFTYVSQYLKEVFQKSSESKVKQE